MTDSLVRRRRVVSSLAAAMLLAAIVAAALVWWSPAGDAVVALPDGEPAAAATAAAFSASVRQAATPEEMTAPAGGSGRTAVAAPQCRVQVVDVDTNRPVGGVQVVASVYGLDDDDEPRQEISVRAGADGFVSLTLARGLVALLALRDADYYITSGAELELGKRQAPATLFVRGGTRLLGRVVDTVGNGVADARVSVNFGRQLSGDDDKDNERPMIWYPAAVATCVADDQGFYVLRGVARCSRWRLVGEHAGHAVSLLDVPLPDHRGGAVEVAPLVLGTGRVLQVLVRDVAGAPVPGADVRLLPDFIDMRSGGMRVLTDAAGLAVFVHVADGKHELRVSAPGHADHRLPAVRPTGEDVVVCLAASLTLTGHVRDAAGAPVAGARLSVREGGRRFRTRTDAGGWFVLGGLPAVSLQLLVTADGYADRRERVAAEAAGQPLDLRLRAARR